MTKKCELLGGSLAYSIQILLGIAALATLVYKRHIERPQRPANIWAFDVGKQLVGGFLVHFMNIGVSSILGKQGDECAWYFINFFVDCTLGVAIVYTIHEGICRLAIRRWGRQTALARIGEYGEPPDMKVWLKQCAAYVTSIIVNKAVVASLLYAAEDGMTAFGNWLFGPLQPTPQIELVVVMVLCPWLLTSFQFWVFDFILMAKNNTEGDEGSDRGSPYAALAAEKIENDDGALVSDHAVLDGLREETEETHQEQEDPSS